MRCIYVYMHVYLDDVVYIYIYHGPPKPTLLEVLMLDNLVSRWPKPLFFMVWGGHGIYDRQKFVVQNNLTIPHLYNIRVNR